MRVYVARHGETTWNLAGRYQGRRESGLSALGVQQGFALADAFTRIEPRIARIIASPLLRCNGTAKFVADRLNVTLENDDRLLEIAHGTWEGRLRDEIAANEPELYVRWREQPADVRFEGGESLADVHARWREFAHALDASQPVLVVTHDAVVRVAILDVLGRSLDDFWKVHVENAGFAEFDADDGRWTLIEESATAHLHGLRAETKAQAL
jgi:broad specificity phosphatase PhoE